jgi:hypothetical protein
VLGCFTDVRDPQRIEHELSAMLVQRIYGLPPLEFPFNRNADIGKFLGSIVQGIWMRPVSTISPILLAACNQRLTEIGRS